MRYHSVLRSPENQWSAKPCWLLSPPSPASSWTCGKGCVLPFAWGWERWEKQASPFTGRLRCGGKACVLPQPPHSLRLARPAKKRRETWETRPLILLSPFYRWKKQGTAGLKHNQDLNSGLLIPSVGLFPLWHSDSRNPQYKKKNSKNTEKSPILTN